MTAAGTIDREGFELKKPVLVCRWRLSHRRLPLKNRHMRALLARTVNGRPVDQPLAAWVKQHIEWTLDKGASEHPDGVLLFVIDAEGQAAMAVGPYASLEDTSLAALVSRAARARQEAMQTGVSPEGKIEGYLTATGSVPSFFEQIKMRGLELSPEIFTPAKGGEGRN